MRTDLGMTAEHLWGLPDDGYRYELIHGTLVREPPTGFTHADVASELLSRLRVYARTHGLGSAVGTDAGFILMRSPDTVLAPDIAFVSQSRLEAVGGIEGYWPCAPDLAVEIMSPSNPALELERKAALYLEAGTRLVWLINPKRRSAIVHAPGVHAIRIALDGSLQGGDVVPGFSCPLSDLFASL